MLLVTKNTDLNPKPFKNGVTGVWVYKSAKKQIKKALKEIGQGVYSF
jgi:hypothetical protein